MKPSAGAGRSLRPDVGRLAPSGSQQRIGGKPNLATGTTNAAQIAGLYDLEETLGEGHYAVVKAARHVFTGERVAVKVIDKTKLDAATRVQMMQEVRLMKLVQHPHVVRLYEVIDTQTKLYLVLELADGGDMYDYIMRHEGVGLDESAARKYFKQIVQAIQYCHELHVVHRDLKPENVVFFQRLGLVKLTDFGFSNKFDPGEQLQTSCGSLAYSAPEILLGDSYDAPAVDIWSLGVILYMLVCGAAPFQEANDSETLTMIMDCKYSFPNHISTACKKLVSLMLQRQPHLRASLEDIIKDPWLNESSNEESTFVDAKEGAGNLPLVSREHLSEEEHSNIIQRMVNGSVATKDDIIEALDCNEYNHITATYFLLAERKLRTKRDQMMSPKGSNPEVNRMQMSISNALVRPVVETMGAVASSNLTKEGLTSQATNTSSGSFSIVNNPLISPPGDSTESSPNSTIMSQFLAVTTDVGASTALSNISKVNKHTPRILQGASAKFIPNKHRKRRPMHCSIVEEECGGIVEEEEEIEEDEEENDDFENKKLPPSVCLDRRGNAAGGIRTGHVSSAGILSTEPALHSSTQPLPIVGAQTNLLSVRRRSSDRSSNSSRSSDGALTARVGSPVTERGTNSPKTPTPFPITSQIGSGSLSRQGSLNRGRTSDRSAATSHSSTPNSVSERSSPSSPPGSNTSSNHSSPVARTRISLTGTGAGNVGIGVITGSGRQHKLVATRSSPQLMHHTTHPALKEIHEECEDLAAVSATGSTTGSPVSIPLDKDTHCVKGSSEKSIKEEGDMSVVDAFPTTREGAAVLRRLEQRRRLRMNQARAASCSSSEASEDEAGSSGNLHSKLSKPLSSALLQKGATTLARISERPHSSPAASQRSGKKRHGVTGTPAEESQDTNEDEEKLSPFQSACTQPRLRKGRENSNQDDSSDNQDSGAAYSKGRSSGQVFISNKTGDDSSQGERREADKTTEKTSGHQEQTCKKYSEDKDLFKTSIFRQSDKTITDKESNNSKERFEKSHEIKSRATKKINIARKTSVDSTEDSGEWDDIELISFLPHFHAIKNDQDDDCLERMADDSAPSSLDFNSKSPSPKSPCHSITNLKSTAGSFSTITQQHAKMSKGKRAANEQLSHINGSALAPVIKGMSEEADSVDDDEYIRNLPVEYQRLHLPLKSQRPPLQNKPRKERNLNNSMIRDLKSQIPNKSAPLKTTMHCLIPSKPDKLNQPKNDKPLYRAHSCGSLFSMQHTRGGSGHIAVRHRRLSSQLCLPVDSIPGFSMTSVSNNGISAHVTATVFIDIYSPYSPASPTLIGSPASSPSSGDDMSSFKGFNRPPGSESLGVPIMF